MVKETKVMKKLIICASLTRSTRAELDPLKTALSSNTSLTSLDISDNDLPAKVLLSLTDPFMRNIADNGRITIKDELGQTKEIVARYEVYDEIINEHVSELIIHGNEWIPLIESKPWVQRLARSNIETLGLYRIDSTIRCTDCTSAMFNVWSPRVLAMVQNCVTQAKNITSIGRLRGGKSDVCKRIRKILKSRSKKSKCGKVNAAITTTKPTDGRTNC